MFDITPVAELRLKYSMPSDETGRIVLNKVGKSLHNQRLTIPFSVSVMSLAA